MSPHYYFSPLFQLLCIDDITININNLSVSSGQLLSIVDGSTNLMTLSSLAGINTYQNVGINNGNLVSSSEDKTIKVWNTDLFYDINIIKGYSNNLNEKSMVKTNDGVTVDNNLIEKLSTIIQNCDSTTSKCFDFLNNLNDLLLDDDILN